MKDLYKTYSVEQNSKEWDLLRGSIPTASCASKLVTPTGKDSGQLEKYAKDLAWGMVGVIPENYQNYAMKQGHLLEEEAKDHYSLSYEPVQKVGFTTTLDGNFGYSPDGILSVGALEVKSTNPDNYLDLWVKYGPQGANKGQCPSEFFCQCQAAMYVTKAPWVDLFIWPSSGAEKILENSEDFIIRVYPDQKYLERLKIQAEKVILERDNHLAIITKNLGLPIPDQIIGELEDQTQEFIEF